MCVFVGVRAYTKFRFMTKEEAEQALDRRDADPLYQVVSKVQQMCIVVEVVVVAVVVVLIVVGGGIVVVGGGMPY